MSEAYYEPIMGETVDVEEGVAPPEGATKATAADVDRTRRMRNFDMGTAVLEKIPGVRHLTSNSPADEQAQRDRAQTLEEENPAVSLGAELVPELALSMAGGALISGATKAYGAATAARAGMLAEGALGGAMGEAERAFMTDEGFSVGNMVAFGVGGELIGRLSSRAIRAGGELVTNAFARSARKATTEAVEEAIATGDRKLIRKMGPEVLEKAGKQFDEAAETLSELPRRVPLHGVEIKPAPVQLETAQTVSRRVFDLAVDHPESMRLAQLADDLAVEEAPEKIFTRIDELADELPELRPVLQDEAVWGREAAERARMWAEAPGDVAFDGDRAAMDQALSGFETRAKLALDQKGLKAVDAARQALDLRDAAQPSMASKAVELIADYVAPGAAAYAAGQVDPALGAAVAAGSRYTGVLKRLVGGSQSVTRRAAQAFVRGSAKAAESVLPAAAVATMPRAVEAFSAGYPNPEAAFADRRNALANAKADPIAAAEQWSKGLGDFPLQHPEIHQAIVARTAEGLQYLQGALPASVLRTIRNPNGLPPGRSEIARFASVWQAVTEPAETIKAFGAGTVRPEAMQALAAVHPDLFSQLQYETLSALSTAATVSTEAKIRLDSLLQLDGAATPALSSTTARTIQAANAPKPSAGGTMSGTGPQNAGGLQAIAGGPTGGSPVR